MKKPVKQEITTPITQITPDPVLQASVTQTQILDTLKQIMSFLNEVAPLIRRMGR